MNKVLITGLGTARDLGICDACHLDFTWLYKNPSVLLWADELCIPQSAFDIEKARNESSNIEILEYEEPVQPSSTNTKEYLIQNGVDMNKALELLGDIDMYNDTIKDFYQELETKWNRIVEFKNNNDMANYAIDVHSLKSDCKYLGFMKLAEVAYQHELKSKENDLNYVINNFKQLEEEYKNVLRITTRYLEK